ncbi:MAG TPA: 4-alpha-glucanotransferase [Chloroflexia bacterium]|nr:4-alpha-glucanotransferase [Chloroflexia bacterium]
MQLNFERASGILLHPTSLPGPYGIGDLGAEAYHFIDFLKQTGQKLWQILPLAPTGYGDSPYAALSAFAGNPLLISPDLLLEQGLLQSEDLQNVPAFPENQVDFGPLLEWKMALLARSYQRFKSSVNEHLLAEIADFEKENANWLEDFALFMAAKTAHNGVVWNEWEEGLALRKPESIAAWREKLQGDIEFHKYLQFQFFKQWLALKNYANERNIKIIGDIPIFVAYDSADVWAHPDFFYLDEKGRTTLVAGVPPDYFSATGQYWGNPLYRWDYMASNGYAWWIERFSNAFRLYDFLRIDHFRGFAAYWEVPVNEEKTAANGRWVKGPGVEFFQFVQKVLGDRPVIAEDLGVITPDVVEIRETMGYPGMRVLQFAFGAFETDATDPYLPHNYEHNTVVYTGTHDNDTTAGWYTTASENEKKNVRHYLDLDEANNVNMGAVVASKMVRLAFSSVANMAIVPLQDLLGLGSEARMNRPGTASGNWRWRLQKEMLTQEVSSHLYDITVLFARYVPPTDHPLKGQGNM